MTFLQHIDRISQEGKLSKEINTTFFTLITKVPNAMDLKEYRTISLVGYIYKVVV